MSGRRWLLNLQRCPNSQPEHGTGEGEGGRAYQLYWNLKSLIVSVPRTRAGRGRLVSDGDRVLLCGDTAVSCRLSGFSHWCCTRGHPPTL